MTALPPPTAALLADLQAWAEAGWLRRLDAAFAAFVAELDPAASPPLLMAAALVAHLEGRGHSCLDIDELLRDADGLLAWTGEAGAALRTALAGLPGDAAGWCAALRASPVVGIDPPADGREPLRLRGTRLYLRRYARHEADVAAQVLARSGAAPAWLAATLRPWLDRLFPVSENESGEAMDWQKAACAIAAGAPLAIVTGGPGTGKTYTAARLLALLLTLHDGPQPLRVALAAPTGKAAARLKQSIDGALQSLQAGVGPALDLAALAGRIGPARTLHALLGARPDTRAFAHDAARPLALEVLIVDEASMVHLEMMAALLAALPAGARLVLLGDKDQLASVEAGAVLGDLCRDAERGRYDAATAAHLQVATGMALPMAMCDDAGPPLAQQTVMLRRSRRFDGPIGELAQAVNAGDHAKAEALLQEAADGRLLWLKHRDPAVVVRLAVQGRAGAEGGYASYLRLLQQRDTASESDVPDLLQAFEQFRVLCAAREGDWGAAGMNAAIERALAAEGLLQRRGEWYEGRPVMVTRNDAALGVFNGDIGIVLRLQPGGPLRACFPAGDTYRAVGVGRLADVQTAFALTVHKAQGSEFAHTVLVLPPEPGPLLTRELVYTGITRARQAFTLAGARPQALAEALAQRTRRSSGLLDRLQAGSALHQGEP